MMHCAVLTRDLLFSSQVAATARRVGHLPSTATSVAAILARVEEDRDYYVIVDLTLADIEIATVVRQLQGAEHTPLCILAVGPHVHAGRLSAAVEAGCDRVLTKGEASRNLAAVLETVGQG